MIIDRWNRIINILIECKEIRVEELAKKVDVSIATIRRDIKHLTERKVLTCKNGIVYSTHIMASLGPEYASSDIIYMRETLNTDIKITLGKYAAGLIRDEDIIFIDAGTTVNKMIPFISAKDVLAVTNSVSAISLLGSAGLKAYICSGYITTGSDAIYDSVYNRLEDIHITKAFLGTSAVNKKGFYSSTRDYEIKKEIIANSDEVYIIADSAKYNRTAFRKFASPDEAVLITESAPPFENDLNYIIVDCKKQDS